MTTYPTGLDLLDRIADCGMQPIRRSSICNTFDSYVPRAVSEAQGVLLASGYRLESAEMIEREVYTMKFRSPGNAYPYSVMLRYINGGPNWPFLALCYMDGRRLIQYIGRFKRTRLTTVTSTDSIQAVALVAAFEAEFGERRSLWVPVLERSPLVVL